MTTRSKKGESQMRRQSQFSKDAQKKRESQNLVEDEKPVDQIDPRDIVMRELLESLLSLVTKTKEINKSFAKLTFLNGNSYDGWLGPNGFNGFGTYKFAVGSSFRGCPNKLYDLPLTYVAVSCPIKGKFEDSLTRGLGRYSYANGDGIYEGEFLAGHRHGYGRYKTSRFRYEGNFELGKFHGQGTWKSRQDEQNGIFHNGSISYGEIRDSSGTFKGTFDEHSLRKKGKFTFNNGNTYNGSWANDLFWGFGIYNWVEEGCMQTKTETKYTGYWLNGERYGSGMLTFRKRVIICQWNRDKKSGAGVTIACNGNCYASPNMFLDNHYKGSHRILMNEGSREILLHLVKLTNPDTIYDSMEEKSEALYERIIDLIEGYSEAFAPINPIRVPHFELGVLPHGVISTPFELRYLQQVLTENYHQFRELYLQYTHPADEYMNKLGLGLFYLDVFQNVRDVSVYHCMAAANNAICHQCSYGSTKDRSCENPLAAVPFYDFFQHFAYISEILMESCNLKAAAELLRPTFFSQLAIHILLVLKMVLDHERPKLLAREGIFVNRPAMLKILSSMEDESVGDKSIRAAYRFLKARGVISNRCLEFIEAVNKLYDDVFQDDIPCQSELELTDVERIEIVLYTCQIKLAKDEMRKTKNETMNAIKNSQLKKQ